MLALGELAWRGGSFWTGFCRWCESVSKSISCMWGSVPALFVEKTLLFPLDCLCSFVKDQVPIFVYVYFWVLCFEPLICLFILPQYNTVLITVASAKAWSWVVSVLWPPSTRKWWHSEDDIPSFAPLKCSVMWEEWGTKCDYEINLQVVVLFITGLDLCALMRRNL